MNRYIDSALDDLISERIDEILLALEKREPFAGEKAESDAALQAVRNMVAGNTALEDQLDDAISCLRSLNFDELKACYLQGFRDFRALLFGTPEPLIPKYWEVRA